MEGAAVLSPLPCPWGNVASNKVGTRVPTMAEVIQEEMNKKVAEERNAIRQQQEEDDLLLAIELSKQSALEEGYGEEIATQEVVAEEPAATETDEDYLMALRLQEEYDAETLRNHRSSNTKVSVIKGMTKEQYLAAIPLVDSDSEDEADEEEDEEEELLLAGPKPATAKGAPAPQAKISRRQKLRNRVYQKHDLEFDGTMNSASLENMESSFMKVGSLVKNGTRLPAKVYNSLKEDVSRMQGRGIRIKEKSDHATSEQVLDPKTRILLLKMMNAGTLSELNGVISTGKESRVYHALSGEGENVAIKIYKTTLNEFKDRGKYLIGEWRFRHKTNNPRKLIKVWAEKELKNLKILNECGIPAPTPLLIRGHCLLMTFIGEANIPAPRLRDVPFTTKGLKEVYLQIIKQMRSMYQVAHLVHADFSEFNILYHKKQPYFIDVSQSVEWDHVNALAFLQKDCTNIITFFRKSGLAECMTIRQLFEFITDATLADESLMEMYLQKMEELAIKRFKEGISPEEQIDEEVFKKSFIPRTLAQIENPIEELERVETEGDLLYRTVAGLSTDLCVSKVPAVLEDEFSDDEEDEEELAESDEEDEGEDDDD